MVCGNRRAVGGGRGQFATHLGEVHHHVFDLVEALLSPSYTLVHIVQTHRTPQRLLDHGLDVELLVGKGGERGGRKNGRAELGLGSSC